MKPAGEIVLGSRGKVSPVEWVLRVLMKGRPFDTKVLESTGRETSMYCRARSLETTDSPLTSGAMISNASRGIARPVLGPAKAQTKNAPSLAKSAPSTRRGALRLCIAMATSPILEAYVKGKCCNVENLRSVLFGGRVSPPGRTASFPVL